MKTDVTIDEILSFGVEEEFVLADMSTRFTAPRAAEVLDKARPQLGEHAQREFYATQVEFTTEPCMSAEQLRSELVRARQIGAAASAAAGCLLVAAASAVLTRRPLPITADARYELIAERYTAGISSEISGCHVHVGTLPREEAILLGNHLRPWLPVLQALCVNSPFAAQQDRHCSSWRYFDVKALPTVEPAPMLDEAAYERMADSLTTDGPLLDRKMIYWYSRPSEHCPTLEIRIADANPDLDLVLLYAVLLRGLATTLLAEARDGRPWPDMHGSRLEKFHRWVAMDGLRAWAHDPDTGALLPSGTLLSRLVHRSRPGLAAAGDEQLADRLLRRFWERGTVADRQRAVYGRRGRWTDVVDSLVVR
ncbi:carboxylate-amine ligase [Catenulispora sp. GP43]|uniref:carboxylate-amine ligase n=1 Tax=Catenulispora sp. GP43 TaxID=3156263 RepID=UPI0035191D95